MTDTTERVAKGVALLDVQVPNWRDQINVKKLNMSRTDRCTDQEIR
jgi:hypothetical protein